jgi:hypothetical protein
MSKEQGQGPSVKHLLRDTLRIPLEQHVSAYLGRGWRVIETLDKTDFASHPAALLSDGTYAVFVKVGEGRLALDKLTESEHPCTRTSRSDAICGAYLHGWPWSKWMALST